MTEHSQQSVAERQPPRHAAPRCAPPPSAESDSLLDLRDASAWVVQISPQPRLKRLFDFAAATAGLILLAPLFVAIGIAIRIDSRGGVFFLQERIGRGFRPFQLCKFRTMTADAAGRGGPLITAAHDPRVTRVGRVLRQWKIDELPQLFNILRGEMSLVGPRPQTRRYVEMFLDDYAIVLSVLPGITDLASIKYRDEAGVLAQCDDPEETYVRWILPEKLAIAKAEIGNRSMLRDIGVLFRTVVSVLWSGRRDSQADRPIVLPVATPAAIEADRPRHRAA